MSKARITYRFDQSTQYPPLEESRAQPASTSSERDTGKVVPLYQEDDTAKIERLIRGSHAHGRDDGYAQRRPENGEEPSPMYYTSKEADHAFEHLRFYEEAQAPVPFVRRASRRKVNWVGLMSAIAGAVLTGVLLGMFVLAFFHQEDSRLSPLDAEQQAQGTTGADTDANAVPVPGNVPGQPDAALSTSLTVPGGMYYMVQNGVFSNQEGAELAASQLKDKGFAGAIEQLEQLVVYAGIAQHRDDALLISEQMREAGLEVYIKPYELPATSQPTWSAADAEQMQRYLDAGRQLTDAMIAISIAHLNLTSPKAVDEEQITALRTSHQQWTTEANQFATAGTDLAKVMIQGMNTSINSAMQSIEQYQKKPSAAYMWQVQTAAAEYLIQYKQLLSE